MANSNFIVNTSRFTPFSYEELAAPLAEQTKMQMAIEDAYTQLGQNAGAIGSLLNPSNDSRAYQQYTNYMNALSKEAEEIARTGLNSRSRAALSALNARYATDISPIQTAYENRAAEIKRAQEISDKDPTRLLSYNPSQISIDKYMENPSMSFKSQSGALLAEEVAQQVKPIADVLRSAANYGALDNYTKLWLEDRGLSPEEVQYAISNPDDPGVLQGIVERVIATSGIDSWGDRESSIMARYYAQQGLWQAIGKDTPHTYEDYGSREALQDYYATRRALRTAKASGAGDDLSRGSVWRQHDYMTPGNRRGIKNSGDIKAMNDMLRSGKADVNIISRIAKDNGFNVNDIIDEYGNFKQDGTDKLMNKLGKLPMLNTEFELYLADYGLTSDVLNRALNVRSTKGLSSGFREVSGGRIKDKDAREKDVREYLNDSMAIVFSPQDGYFVVGQNKDGESKRFLVSPEVISGLRPQYDDGTYDLNNNLTIMQQAYLDFVNRGDFQSANELKEDIGHYLYSTFNSLAKVQSKSSSKDLE